MQYCLNYSGTRFLSSEILNFLMDSVLIIIVVQCAISESPKPLFQSEANCEIIDIETIFYSHANDDYFHKKDFALSLVMKARYFSTRNWPIIFSLANPFHWFQENNPKN